MSRPLTRRRAYALARPFHAWDLETTSIAAGTPEPRYITLWQDKDVSGWPAPDYRALHDIVIQQFLIDEYIGHRFIAFNSNRFDNYFIALALAKDTAYYVEPWLNKSNMLRGMAVYNAGNRKHVWYFSDAMAMFAFEGTLEEFVKLYYPIGQKTHPIDWNKETFDCANGAHVEYAKNDTLILQHAVEHANEIIQEITGIPAQNTIGKLGILYWRKNMPEGVKVWNMPHAAEKLLHHAKRGGLVFCKGRYDGPAWQYDINQSYTHQQRKPLPCGRCAHTWERDRTALGIYACTIQRGTGHGLPFYCKDIDKNLMITTDGSEPITTALVSPEIDVLERAGWTVSIDEGWEWMERFSMRQLADHLERARASCEGGPKGAIGTMIKAIGNNSYGKTVEEVDGIRYRFSADRPGPEWHNFAGEVPEADHLWVTSEEVRDVDYHKLQIGVFITAYARCQLYAQFLQHDCIIYADTDCLITTRDISAYLPISKSLYGAWKIEQDGHIILLNKKSYCWVLERPVMKWKGLTVRDLTPAQYVLCFSDGSPPVQVQTQRQSILKVLSGVTMFHEQERHGSLPLERIVL